MILKANGLGKIIIGVSSKRIIEGNLEKDYNLQVTSSQIIEQGKYNPFGSLVLFNFPPGRNKLQLEVVIPSFWCLGAGYSVAG